jgi:hypothetical protein
VPSRYGRLLERYFRRLPDAVNPSGAAPVAPDPAPAPAKDVP